MKLSCLLMTLLLMHSGACAAEAGRISLAVSEPTGVHRDHAPVHVLLTLPEAVPLATPFRLSCRNESVVAQFRPNSSDAETSEWWLDFLAESAPFETREYVVEYGPDTQPGPERTTGHTLMQTRDAFIVSHAPWISWVVPRDFRGFLSSVDFPPAEHLRAGAVGLTIRDRNGDLHQLGGPDTQSHIIRAGKMAVALRFEQAATAEALQGVQWRADLTFPGPISWVELRLQIDDPQHRVLEACLELNLNLDQPSAEQRTLVELGADRTVYRSLFGAAQVELQAAASVVPAWQVLRSVGEEMQPFVVASAQSQAAEGWVQVMDRRRCLALACDQFGRIGRDRIQLRANGRLTASRTFVTEGASKPGARKEWRLWLHFVHFPPQQSAATDPHMMQNPLIVRSIER